MKILFVVYSRPGWLFADDKPSDTHLSFPSTIHNVPQQKHAPPPIVATIEQVRHVSDTSLLHLLSFVIHLLLIFFFDRMGSCTATLLVNSISRSPLVPLFPMSVAVVPMSVAVESMLQAAVLRLQRSHFRCQRQLQLPMSNLPRELQLVSLVLLHLPAAAIVIVALQSHFHPNLQRTPTSCPLLQIIHLIIMMMPMMTMMNMSPFKHRRAVPQHHGGQAQLIHWQSLTSVR